MKSPDKIKLIIADDHPVFRNGLEMAMRSTGVTSKIALASGGDDVIEHLSKEHYDIVLMDIGMPRMNGIAATEIITANYPNTRVIALSMEEDKKKIEEILAKGAAGYLTKNAATDEIIEAISDVMAG